MSAPKILIAATVATILSTLAYALPRHIRSMDLNDENNNWPSLSSMDLKEVLSKSVCPIVVDYDVNENRVPRRIKVLKCATQPSRCQSKNNSLSKIDRSRECCTHHSAYHLECMEIRDTILVAFKANLPNLTEITVPVGCSCIVQDHKQATTDPGH